MDKDFFIKNINYWDWEAYRDYYPDLKNKSKQFLIHHVLNHGIKENRNIVIKDKNSKIIENLNLLLPNNFNWYEYIYLHDDLQEMNEIDAKIHYIKYGIKEGRKYKYEDEIIKMPSIDYNNNYEKVIIINSIFGLGNRLRSIASAYSISKNKNMKLIINWIPDYHCNCLIEDLIDNIDTYAEVISNPINIDSLKDFKFYNYLETEKGGIKNEYINDKLDKIYVKSNCILNNSYSYLYVDEFLQNLKWNDNVYDLIMSIPEISDYIGIHIRSNVNDKPDNVGNFTEEESKLLLKYREISHIDNFINQINKILHKNPEQKFFIATDMKSNYEKLLNIYGGDRIKILKRNLYNRSKAQLYYAIADIILLSKCKNFFGSTWSSFSELVIYFQKDKKKKQNVFSDKFTIQNLSKKVNFFNQELKQGNSIVCVSMNRSEHILKALPSWLKVNNCNEIVILDYGSDVKLLDILKFHNLNDPKVKIFRVENVSKWHLSKAYNLAIKLSSYKNIYKLDSDNICDKNVIDNHPLNKPDIYYHGRWEDATNENELQIAGTMFFTYDMFIDSNGYNENITTYGWDDCDFDLRLNKIGVRKSICINDFQFIEHSDDIRQDKSSNFSLKQNIQVNRILCEKEILKWNKKFLHSEFVNYKDNLFKLIESFHLTNDFINADILNKVTDLINQHY